MRTPMPSPTGTNREGLYLSPKAAAYDAAMTDGKRGKVREFLGSKLDPADLEALERLLDEEETEADATAVEPEVAQDAASHRQRVDRLYEAGQVTYGQAQDMKRRGPQRVETSGERAERLKQFPNSDRLK